jgi:hypothetical protein
MPLLPNRVIPASTQCLVCGIALLVYAVAGVAITFVLAFELPPPGFEAEAEGRVHISLAVICVCAIAGLLGVLFAKVAWQRSSGLLATAKPLTPQVMKRSSGLWEWAWAGILAVIGLGMIGAFTERSFIDLALGIVFLANFGTATLAVAAKVRRLEQARHIRYYCLADSHCSWQMVWMRPPG